MRNFLIVLTLCVLTLTTSSVFANEYDETKRTERLGLSYYDGRPLYVVMFGFTGPDYAPIGYSMSYYRVFTGDNLSDFGTSSFQGEGRRAVVTYGDITVQERYFYSVIDADGMTVFSSNVSYSDPYRAWTLELMERYPPPQYASEDIGVYTFDAISERVKTWVLAALIFAGSFLCAKFGFREMLRFAGTGLGGKLSAASLTSDSTDVSDDREAKKAERENFEAFKRSWDAIRELGAADAYATGEAYGLTFTAKVVKSNQILQESWSRLSEEERQFLTNEARRMAWQDDLIDEKERIYRQTVMNTALLRLEDFAGASPEIYSNPYGGETSDEDDDSEPVPRPGAAPLPYVALEEDEDDGLTFPGEAPSVPNRRYRETYDDYDAANRALDESYYDDEGGYW